jgi:hypothetical protein
VHKKKKSDVRQSNNLKCTRGNIAVLYFFKAFLLKKKFGRPKRREKNEKKEKPKNQSLGKAPARKGAGALKR